MTKKKIISIILASVMLVVIFSGCVKSNSNVHKTTIAVSIVPEATFVKAVVSDKADVITMIPPGSSPESYEPTPQQMAKFSDSRVYFTIGVPAEKNNIIKNVNEKTDIVSLEDIVATKYKDLMLGEERDPHIWLSPKRAIVIVETIRDKMNEIDPANKEYYTENAKKYIDELSSINDDINDALKDVKNRKFIVYHPAFGYLADDYNLTMYALENEGKEATPQNLQNMINLAKAENIKVIFYQAEIDSSQSKAFAEEIGGKTIGLDPLSGDYIKNLKGMAKLMAENME